MRAALLTFLIACAPGLKPKETKVAAQDTLVAAAGDAGKMAALVRRGVVNGGLWFEDATCSKFTDGEVAAADRAEFARCLVGLHLTPSAREDALGDVVVMNYAPGFEVEVRLLQELGNPPALTWIGFAAKRNKDALPSISSDALEGLRIAGDRNGPVDPALGTTWERESAPQDDTLGPVDPANKFAMAWVKVCLDESGAITDVDPFVATSTAAEAGFVAAARTWKFRPFTLGGQAMPVCAMARMIYPPTAVAGREVLPMPPPPSRSKKRPRVLSTSRLIEGYRIAGNKQIVPMDHARNEMASAGLTSVRGTFRICLDDTGVPESVLPMRSTGITSYDQTILSEMRKWRYRPYQIDNETVPVCTAVTFIYKQN